jgi:hypothetical protein
MDDPRGHEGPCKHHGERADRTGDGQRQTDRVKKDGKLELVFEIVAREKARRRFVLVFPETGDLGFASQDGLSAAHAEKHVDGEDERHMGDHRPEYCGLGHRGIL